MFVITSLGQYRPNNAISMADAVFRLFSHSSTGVEGSDPGWPMIYNRNPDRELPPHIPSKTCSMVLKKFRPFVDKRDMILRSLGDERLVPYVPVPPRFNNI